ncbi:MAG: hypothetical protein IPG64_17780 [Haliea sp.]|nr:hypothetical protein [Haliea sp.]
MDFYGRHRQCSALSRCTTKGIQKKSAKDILSITVLLEFLVDFYTFSLLAELVIIPVLTLLVCLQVVAKSNEDHKQVASLIDGVLGVLGVIVLCNAFYDLIVGFGAFANAETLVDFATPLLLSLSFLPFIYLLSIYVAYESAFSRIGFRCDGHGIERYAKWRAVYSFNFRYRALRRWADHLNYTRLDSKLAVRNSIAEVKSRLAYEKQPRTIPEDEGWSPFEAKDFLVDLGLKTGHYKHLGDGEWFVSSSALEIGENFSSNSISYYVSGDEFAAKKLTLKLHALQPGDAHVVSEFVRVAEVLLSVALEGQANTNLEDLIEQGTDAHVTSGVTKISIRKEMWEYSDCGQFEANTNFVTLRISTETLSE